MKLLRQRNGIADDALQFAILTAREKRLVLKAWVTRPFSLFAEELAGGFWGFLLVHFFATMSYVQVWFWMTEAP